jgi:probable HAF family extracellular repeat protein
MKCPSCAQWFVTAFLIATLAVCAAATDSGQTQYRIIDLTLPGGTTSTANAINNLGEVTGCSDSADHPGLQHAFLFSHGKLKDLGVPPGAEASCGNAINIFGHVVGNGTTADQETLINSFIFRDHKLTVLDEIPAGSFVAGINVFDQIVGTEGARDSASAAFVFSHGTLTKIGALPEDHFSSAHAINNFGQITGSSWQDQAQFPAVHGFLFSQGIFTPIGLLPGGEFSIGSAINDRGQITGRADTEPPNFSVLLVHAILFDHGKLTDISPLIGGGQTLGAAINNRGQIVGSMGPGGPFLFDGTKGVSLNRLPILPPNAGIFLGSPTGINDCGQIVGSGSVNNQLHAFLLSPVSCPTGRFGHKHDLRP